MPDLCQVYIIVFPNTYQGRYVQNSCHAGYQKETNEVRFSTKSLIEYPSGCIIHCIEEL